MAVPKPSLICAGFVLGLPWLLAACTGEGLGPSGMDLGAHASSLAMVEIDRVRSEADTGERLTVRAAFARFQGVDGDFVLGLVGGRGGAELEACRVVPGLMESAPVATARVDLMDVGPLEVVRAGRALRVLPKSFAELGDFVSGAFYAEDVSGPMVDADVEAAELVVGAAGGALPAFRAVVAEPPPLRDVFLDGAALAPGHHITRGPGLELFWTAGDIRDRVVIELASAGRTLECMVRDDGAFRLGADVTWDLEPSASARLTLRRVRTQSVEIASVDLAWVSVTAGTVVPVRLE